MLPSRHYARIWRLHRHQIWNLDYRFCHCLNHLHGQRAICITRKGTSIACTVRFLRMLFPGFLFLTPCLGKGPGLHDGFKCFCICIYQRNKFLFKCGCFFSPVAEYFPVIFLCGKIRNHGTQTGAQCSQIGGYRTAAGCR